MAVVQQLSGRQAFDHTVHRPNSGEAVGETFEFPRGLFDKGITELRFLFQPQWTASNARHPDEQTRLHSAVSHDFKFHSQRVRTMANKTSPSTSTTKPPAKAAASARSATKTAAAVKTLAPTAPTKAGKPSSKAVALTKPAANGAPGSKAKNVAPAPPPKLAKATVITLKQLAGQLGQAHGIPSKQAQDMLDGVVGLLVEHLKAGDKLRLNGLGILEVKDRPARAGRNPATGAAIQIAASKKIAFRPARELKDAI